MRAPGPSSRLTVMLFALLVALSCAPGESTGELLTAHVPLHLEEHLEVARIDGSRLPPGGGSEALEWRFDEEQPDWKVTPTFLPDGEPARVSRVEDALRIVVDEASDHGGIHIDLPEWRRHEWAYVVVRARSRDVDHIEIAFNLKDRRQWESSLAADKGRTAYRFQGEDVPIVPDGEAHDYVMRADWSSRGAEAPFEQLGIEVGSHDGTLDILSVSVLPKDAAYGLEPVGVTLENRGGLFYHAIFTHTPSSLAYRVRVPDHGRLDLGLGVVNEPVTFRVSVGGESGETVTVMEETHADEDAWAQRTVDLERWAGSTVTLSLSAEAERDGAISLWAAPTLTGTRETEMPNIIFYVIDGAGADFMSVYGYNRRTTPNLERLAATGAVFEHAYSNSSWTKPSTRSFMTSLHDSVLGGLRTDGDPLPEEAVTMAERFHDAGYQTGVFTANPWAGRVSSLDRGVDVLREGFEDSNTGSSAQLHDGLWQWRESYPGEPFWAHFQTTDVHMPYEPPPPFAGLYLDAGKREAFYQSRPLLRSGLGGLEGLLESARALHDESMAHNDYQIGRLVERLEASGVWDNTILIVASDHGMSAGGWSAFSPLPAPWGPIFTPFVSRIPLIVVWPGHIEPGQRFIDPVSMIDVLPTALDLAGLPLPEVAQGQSLAPLLLGESGWEPRPVIFDEFRVDAETGELSGRLEMIDGRWGASLAIGSRPVTLDLPGDESEPRPAPLLLYDLWSDPYCMNNLHDERPDLVEKYAALLEQQWAHHRELGERFTPAEAPALDAEQLRNLRALGYIQ